MSPLRIIIVGAGIGGPAAGIGLARNGHQVTIYERATTIGGVGYAFRITPNSDRCLKYLGIDPQTGGAVSSNTVRLLNADGVVLHEVTENTNTEKSQKAASVFAYRPQLHQQLMDVARESGVDIRTGVRVKSVDVANTAVELEDGTTINADIIIAADGVHSVVRPNIVDATRYFPRASTGHNAFRFMVSTSAVQNDSVLSSAFKDDIRMLSWVGHDKRFLVYPVDYETQFNITATHPAHLSDEETSHVDSADAVAYNQKVSLDTVLSIYSDFEPRVTRLLEMADPHGFRVWKLMDMDEIPTWSRHHTVLLGDACHPVSPFGFSGASMAIEDALTLVTLLTADLTCETATEHHNDGDDPISARLKLYEQIRRPRVGRVRDTARDIARGRDNDHNMAEYREFLGSHDAVAHATRALEKHVTATARS